MTTAILRNTFLKFTGAGGQRHAVDPRTFGRKMGLAVRLFGCWHENLSRPFGKGRETYRCCMQCGARRQFDPETLTTFGSYYAPPAVEKELT